MQGIAIFIWTLIIFFLSALPLNIAVKALNGKTNILKTASVILIGGLIVYIIQAVLGFFGGIVSFIVLIWVYRISFRLRWFKALIAWILQFIVLALLYVLVFIVLGVSIGLSTLSMF